MFKNNVHKAQKAHCVSITNIDRLFLFRDTINVHSKNYTTTISTLRWQTAVSKHGASGKYSNQLKIEGCTAVRAILCSLLFRICNWLLLTYCAHKYFADSYWTVQVMQYTEAKCNSSEQSSSWEADSLLRNILTHRTLCNTMVHYRIHKSPPMDHTLRQTNLVHNQKTQF